MNRYFLSYLPALALGFSSFSLGFLSAEVQMTPLVKPVPEKEWSRVERIPGFEGDYQYISFADRIQVRNNQNKKVGSLGVLSATFSVGTTFKTFLQNHPELLPQLGPAMTSTVLLMNQEIRAQIFQKGVLMQETKTGRFWYDLHQPRPRVQDATGEILKIPKIRLGKGTYDLAIYQTQVVITDLESRESAILKVGSTGQPLSAEAKAILAKDEAFAHRVGQPVSPQHSLFNQALNAQVFEGGCLLWLPGTERFSRAWHAKRVPSFSNKE